MAQTQTQTLSTTDNSLPVVLRLVIWQNLWNWTLEEGGNDLNNNKGGWYRELPSKVDDGGIAILAFTSKREARQRAAQEYGYGTYTEVKRDGWCEVRSLSE